MNLLFAQMAVPAPPAAWNPFAAQPWAVLAVVVVVLLPISLALLRAARRRREWDHAERMRMLEMGMPVPPRDLAAGPKSLVCIAIGAGVPLLSFFFAYLAHQRPGAAEEIFVAPAVVSVASVIGASLLGARLFSSTAPTLHDTESNRVNGKPAEAVFDPDSYDVAGRRG